MSGFFLTVEGGEGAGKTSNLEFIVQFLTDKGKDIVLTREPGGTSLGEDIRQLLLGHRHEGMSDDCELLLMFAARSEHLTKVIQPALDAGKWVVCDRFTDATYAYQGGGRGVSMDRIQQLEQWTQGSLKPDLTLVLDVPIEVGMKRVGQRGSLDRFEKQEMDFFRRVRRTYLERAELDPGRFRVINAANPLDEVQSDIKRILDLIKI